jgi:hypothetical protein
MHQDYDKFGGTKTMQKKLNALITTALFATSAAAYADVSESQVRNLENRVSALEQRKSAGGMINPSGRPEVKDGANIFITGDFLYWQAHENGLSYVLKTQGSDIGNNAKTKEMHFQYDPGFRVGLGWNTPHDGWDLYANWTSFVTKAHGEETAGSKTLTPIFGNRHQAFTFANYLPKSAKAHWNLNLNLVDVELGREFFVSKWLTLRPFAGLRSAWINQRMHTEYKGMQPTSSSFVSLVDHMTSKYWGIGIRPGLNTQWGLGCGFSFYGNASLSLLYGYFHQKQHEYSKNTYTDLVDYVDLKHSNRVGRAFAETQLGIRWEHMFANDHGHFSIQAGWENLMFFGMNQFERLYFISNGVYDYVANQGDLTIQGYTLSIRFDF